MSTRKGRKRLAPVEIEVELADEDTSDAAFLERVKAPLQWGTLPVGFTTRDIREAEFETVIEFIKETYLCENLLCNNINILEDEQSVEDILLYFLNILKDRSSICIVHDETNTIAGVALLRVINKEDYGKVFSRLRLTEGEAFGKIKRAYNFLNRKTDLFTMLECESYLRVYVLSVHPDYRKRNLGLFLLRAAVGVTRSLNLLVLMGIFDKNNFQKKARKVGLETVFEIYYVDWLENGEIAFSDPGPGNYTLALMAGRLFSPKKRSSARSSRASRASSKREGSKILRKISKQMERDSQGRSIRASRGSKSGEKEAQGSKSEEKGDRESKAGEKEDQAKSVAVAEEGKPAEKTEEGAGKTEERKTEASVEQNAGENV